MRGRRREVYGSCRTLTYRHPPRPFAIDPQNYAYTEPCQHKVQEAIQNNYGAIAGTAVAVAVFQVRRQPTRTRWRRLSG